MSWANGSFCVVSAVSVFMPSSSDLFGSKGINRKEKTKTTAKKPYNRKALRQGNSAKAITNSRPAEATLPIPVFKPNSTALSSSGY